MHDSAITAFQALWFMRQLQVAFLYPDLYNRECHVHCQWMGSPPPMRHLGPDRARPLSILLGSGYGQCVNAWRSRVSAPTRISRATSPLMHSACGNRSTAPSLRIVLYPTDMFFFNACGFSI